jgi:hypothetical protein
MLVPLYLDITHASNRWKCELHHITWLAIANSEPDPVWCPPAARPTVQESCVKSMRSWLNWSAASTITQ